MTELIIRPDAEVREYGLYCGFDIEAYPKASRLEKVTLEVGQRWVRDMAKQGWEWRGDGIVRSRPRVPEQVMELKRPDEQDREGSPVQKPQAGESWKFFLYAIFRRKEIRTEYGPDGPPAPGAPYAIRPDALTDGRMELDTAKIREELAQGYAP